MSVHFGFEGNEKKENDRTADARIPSATNGLAGKLGVQVLPCLVYGPFQCFHIFLRFVGKGQRVRAEYVRAVKAA